MKVSLYFKATFLLIVYFILSKFIFVESIVSRNVLIAFLSPMIFGAIAGIFFLYLFTNDDFFKFAKLIERRKYRTERKWIHIFWRFGKFLASVIIGTIGGPIFAALSIKILLPSFRYGYLVVILCSIPSTIFSVGVARGAIGFIF